MASIRTSFSLSLHATRRSARQHSSSVLCFLPSNGNKTKVKFVLPKKVAYGQSVNLVGSKPDLGHWDPSSSLSLEWHEGHEWTVETELPVGEEIEYKYVIRNKEGGLEWQPGSNIVLALPGNSTQVMVVDDWLGKKHDVKMGAGAQVAEEDALVDSLEEELVQPFSAPVAQPPEVTEAEEPAVPQAMGATVGSGNGASQTVAAVAEQAEEGVGEGEGAKAMLGAENGGVAASAASMGTQALEEMTVKALRKLAKDLGVPADGRKMDLVDSIKDAMGYSD